MGKRNVVRTKNGRYVAVDTALLPEKLKWYGIDDYETMVFACDKNGKVTSWEDLDIKTAKDIEEAEKVHKEMIKKWEDMNYV